MPAPSFLTRLISIVLVQNRLACWSRTLPKRDIAMIWKAGSKPTTDLQPCLELHSKTSNHYNPRQSTPIGCKSARSGDIPTFESCQKVFHLSIGIQAEAKEWLATGTLAHHRQQEASTPRNEAEETTMLGGTEIGGMMDEFRGGAVDRGASM